MVPEEILTVGFREQQEGVGGVQIKLRRNRCELVGTKCSWWKAEKVLGKVKYLEFEEKLRGKEMMEWFGAYIYLPHTSEIGTFYGEEGSEVSKKNGHWSSSRADYGLKKSQTF